MPLKHTKPMRQMRGAERRDRNEVGEAEGADMVAAEHWNWRVSAWLNAICEDGPEGWTLASHCVQYIRDNAVTG